MMILDWILASVAFFGSVLAVGKYASTSQHIRNTTKNASTHTCLCSQCAHFKPKEKGVE